MATAISESPVSNRLAADFLVFSPQPSGRLGGAAGVESSPVSSTFEHLLQRATGELSQVDSAGLPDWFGRVDEPLKSSGTVKADHRDLKPKPSIDENWTTASSVLFPTILPLQHTPSLKYLTSGSAPVVGRDADVSAMRTDNQLPGNSTTDNVRTVSTDTSIQTASASKVNDNPKDGSSAEGSVNQSSASHSNPPSAIQVPTFEVPSTDANITNRVVASVTNQLQTVIAASPLSNSAVSPIVEQLAEVRAASVAPGTLSDLAMKSTFASISAASAVPVSSKIAGDTSRTEADEISLTDLEQQSGSHLASETAETLFAGTANSVDQSQNTGHSTASSLVSQLSSSVIRQLTDDPYEGPTQVRIRLDESELGTVDLHLSVTNDVVSIRIAAHDPATQRLIDGQLDSLRQSLNQSGVQCGQLEVAGRSSGLQFTGQSGSGNRSGTTLPASTSRWGRHNSGAVPPDRSSGLLNYFA